MQNYWWCAILFRIVLPLFVTVGIFMRPTVTSYVYLIAGCYMPFFSVPTHVTMTKSTGTYMKVLILTCVLTSSLVVSFYFTLFFQTEGDFEIEYCAPLEKLIRTIGIIGYERLSWQEIIPWALPEPLMLLTSVVLFVVFKKLNQDTEVIRATIEMEDTLQLAMELNRKKMLQIMLNLGKYVVVLLLCITAVLKPCLPGLIYYLVFLTVLTYWACNKTLGKLYARILVCLIPLIFLHITIVFWYQFQYFQDSPVFQTESIWGRLFNLVDIRTYNDCKDPRIFKFHAQSNATYAVPICLFLLYYLVVLVAREILQAQDGFNGLLIAFFRRERVSQTKWHRAFAQMQSQRAKEKIPTDSLLADKIRTFIEYTLQFIINGSYLVANFIMMIWAIMYVNWKGLILLIWANLIWLMPFRKKVMLATSPFLVIWVWFLLLTSYMYSLDLTEEELPGQIGIFNMHSVGFQLNDPSKWVHLLTKSLFGVIIFVTMRQLWQERALRKQQRELAEAIGLTSADAVEDLTLDSPKTKLLERYQAACITFLSIWWIWVVILTMISISFWSTTNVFRIVFVGLAFVFIITFQLCPFRYWKIFLRVYWWIVIVYAMINLFVLHTYQIYACRMMMHELISEEIFRRYGFYTWKDGKELTLVLANPLFFQIAVVIQQNYLQKEFDRLTSPTPPEVLKLQEIQLAESGPKWRKTKIIFANAKNVIFGFLEVHIQNLILLVGWYMCIFDMCAIFFPLVVLLTVSCVLGRRSLTVTINIMSCIVQVLIILRLIYMNQYLYHDSWNYVGHYVRNGKQFNKTLNSADWLGFHESRFGIHYADFWQLFWCFFFVFIVTIQRVVSIRMKNYRLPRDLPTQKQVVLFPDITYENCHDSTKNMLKFLANYAYYKFGVEITLTVATVVMGLRMDGVAIVMCFWLLAIFALKRKWKRYVWLPTLIISAIAVPAQYFATLGFWPTYWEEMNTEYWNSNDLFIRIQQFCHLMNMAHPPAKQKISLDYWWLLLLSSQWRAFQQEWRLKRQYNPAGSNENVSDMIDSQTAENPVPDFITYTKSYLELYKRTFFTAWFYMALFSVFLAGTMRPTLYSFGYILGAFVFIWEGTDLFLRPPSAILWRWNLLIGYTILIMLTRTVSQIFGCILHYESDIQINCAIYHLFTIGCVDKFDMTKGVPNMSEVATCEVDYDALGLGYDCLCFFFLIFQQRVFQSFHFFHIVNNQKAQTILADRGCELIEDGRHEKRKTLDAADVFINENIKKKMDKIRATHIKVQGDSYLRRKKNHRQMMKASDYYLFDDAGLANDIPLLPEKKEEKDSSEIDPYDPMPLTEYFGLLHSSDISTVLTQRSLRRQQKAALQEGKKPEDVRRMIVQKESQPGTSKDVSVPIATSSKSKRLLNFLLFLFGAFESFIVSLTGLINRITKDFRNILTQLDRDRLELKENTAYSEGIRLGSNKIWQPTGSYRDTFKKSKTGISQSPNVQFSIYMKLLRAFSYLLLSHSEWLCYCIIVLNQVISGNFISLPLMILMFCWGALTMPIPTKTFWVITIAYVLVMLFIKSFFMLDISPWNLDLATHEANLFFPPAMIGLTSLSNTTFNTIMLIVLFFHRIILNMLGLWKSIEYRTEKLIPDGDYLFKADKLVPWDGTKNQQVLRVTSTTIGMGDYFPKSIIHGAGKYAQNFRLFMQQLISPSSTQIPVDVYTPMFLCDLVNIFLIVFYYGSFGSENENEGFIEFLQDNTVPISFIVVVLVYFFMIVVDRGIYLRKNRFGKLVYHFFQVIACHIWLFVLYPLMTRRHLTQSTPVQIFYTFKCLYFLFSAYQIRNGYPTLISCHFLWHHTTIFNRFGYKLYRLIPYFFELRNLLDWICTDSCLGVTDWFKLEEITQNIFDQKCEQELEDKWTSPASKAKKHTKKYIFGGLLYILLIFTVIFPFVLFSLGDTVGIQTHPSKIKLELYMGSAEPIFKSYASEKNLKHMVDADYVNLTSTFNNVPNSEEIFNTFTAGDVLVVKWSPHSLTKWKVSPGSFNALMEELMSNDTFIFRLEIHYTHIGHGGHKSDHTFGQYTKVPPLPDPDRKNLIDMLDGKNNDVAAWLPLVFPKFLLINKEAKPKPLGIMEGHESLTAAKKDETDNDYEDDDDDDFEPDPKSFRNLLISLQYSNEGDMWWYVREECNIDDDNYFYYLKNLVYNDCENLVMYTFNEKVFSGTMSYIAQSGIIGLYLLYFMMVIGIIRGCRIDVEEIWIEDLPNSDDMFRKCIEVYVARDMQNYELEEELYAQLIFIMRSRELLIKLTRDKDNPYNPPILDKKTK